MSSGLKPQDEMQVAEAVGWACSEGKLLELVGRGTKRAIGRAMQTDYTLDLSALSGITLYEPEELVLSAHAGTPIAEIRKALAAENQELAFEPPDLGALLGSAEDGGSIGGILAANLSGPRRIKAGAARDHFLGVSAVSGRGELFKSGGRVVKNVTGYDMCKGLAGSWGTLAAMTRVTVKVLPRAETTATLLLSDLDAGTAVAAMTAAMKSPFEVSGAAHVPEELAGNCAVKEVAAAGAALTALRLEGFGPSVQYRSEALAGLLAAYGEIERLGSRASERLWRDIRDVRLLADDRERYVWRLSVPPASGARVAAAITRQTAARVLFDWAGGLLWVDVPPLESAHEATIRAAAREAGGHATLIRAPAPVRAGIDVFQLQPAALAALTRRLKDGFDPNRVLNPGRMYAGM